MNGICGKIGFLAVMLACAGCASSTAVHKNLALLQPGVPRHTLTAEFGEPILTVTADNVATDVYGFYQGFSGAGRCFCAGMPDVGLGLHFEVDIEIKAVPFHECEPDDPNDRVAWQLRKQRYGWDEMNRVNSINAANAEAIAAQKTRRAEDLRYARQRRLQELEMLALDQVPGFPGLGLSNPYDRPGSAGVVVFAVTYNETGHAKLFDIAQGQKLVDAARKKSAGWFARKPQALPSSDFFKIAVQHPRATVRSTTLSKVSESY